MSKQKIPQFTSEDEERAFWATHETADYFDCTKAQPTLMPNLHKESPPPMPQPATETVPQKLRPVYDEIVGLTDAFCRAHLNDEYAGVCRALAAKLGRKRPSPLESGRANSWAAAIVYTVGRVNFLFDKSQTPHMRAEELSKQFGLSQSTVSNKARQIMDLLNIGVLDPTWTLPSRMDHNPMAWMISLNGFIIDARYASREIQEEAFRRGLIPYLPGTQGAG